MSDCRDEYRQLRECLRDLVICCDQYDSRSPKSIEAYHDALVAARAVLDRPDEREGSAG